ncbi:flagellar export chaperone FliS [Paraferrimonas sp. SM1919]|uniref:flagellar export chaperone FliS n=1 Tax=Paraferrimonas sp. SM1919 TaxID=2662263 RepID=UPI0013CF904D|nr:flagellar export chaperone FliS [Paraferrimonas sp. SM1919]
MRGSLQSYRKVSVEAQVQDASPHRVIQLLFASCLERLAKAKYGIENNDLALKSDNLTKAVQIIQSLNQSLVMDEDNDVAENLQNLYDYILTNLSSAILENNTDAIEVASDLVRTLKEGWDAIDSAEHHTTSLTAETI